MHDFVLEMNAEKIFAICCAGEIAQAPGTASSLMQSNYDMDIYGEAPDKMTYTEQANKRGHCKRLTWSVSAAINLEKNLISVLKV